MTRTNYCIALLGLSALLGCADVSPEDEVEASGSENALALVTTPVKVTTPLTYWGATGSNPLCNTKLGIEGYTPAEAGRYPLFLYFVGTSDSYKLAEEKPADAVVKELASRGYAAFSVQYDNGLTSGLSPAALLSKINCVFGPKRFDSVVGKLCGTKPGNSTIDCEKGIATWGHSQGAAMAGIAANYDSRVRAAWLTGFGQPFGARPFELAVSLPKERARFVNALEDGSGSFGSANDPATMNELTGRSCTTIGNCFTGSNGSGWYILKQSELLTNKQDHCWFYKNGCLGDPQQLEANWINPASTYAFSLTNNAKWISQDAFLPAIPSADLEFAFFGWQSYQSLPRELGPEEYPAGAVRWTNAGDQKWYVRPPEGAATQNSLVISDSVLGPKSAELTLLDPAGRNLKQVVVLNSGITSATLSVSAYNASGSGLAAFTPVTIAAGATKTVPFSWAIGTAARLVFTSSNAKALKFLKFTLGGNQPKGPITSACPAAKFALKSDNGDGQYVTVQADRKLGATAATVGVNETFTCTVVDAATRKIALSQGGQTVLVGSAGETWQLTANGGSAVPGNAKLTSIDVGQRKLAFGYPVGSGEQYVTSDAFNNPFSHPLLASRASVGNWETFLVVPR